MTRNGLDGAIERSVGVPVLDVQAVRREPIAYDAFLSGRTLTRLRGTAMTADGPRPWSLIEKATDGPASASAYLYDNGRREFLAYESGLLETLPRAVAVPQALGLQRATDGGLLLWLEDLEPGARRLRADDVVAVARDLGELAGHWLARVPSHPWLFTGWLDRHGQPEAVAPALARLRTVPDRTAVEARVGWGIDSAIELIERQADYRRVLRQLPVTLCHHDAVGANVYRRPGPDGEETVLIDWESVGPGPVAADLASLLFASARRGDLPADAVADLIGPATDAYAGGLAAAGEAADRALVEHGLAAAIALRWTLTRDVILSIVDGVPARRGSAPDETADEAFRNLVALTRVLFDCAERARN